MAYSQGGVIEANYIKANGYNCFSIGSSQYRLYIGGEHLNIRHNQHRINGESVSLEAVAVMLDFFGTTR